MILSTLEYDGRIERIDDDDGDRFRQALLAIPETSAFTSIPCGVCPVRTLCIAPYRRCKPCDTVMHRSLQIIVVEIEHYLMLLVMQQSASSVYDVVQVFQECTPDGPISPVTCVYYKQWLDF